LGTHILLMGLNHTTAPIDLRERLAINSTCLNDALAQLCQREFPPEQSGRTDTVPARESNGCRTARLHEGVILSTCNRLEVYAICEDVERGYESLLRFICHNREMNARDFSHTMYRKSGSDAVRHLMRVACGLDSMVTGEPQVLGQVTDAYHAALVQGTAGPVLSALFKRAIRAGKRTHTETAISEHATSVPSVAARLAERVTGGLRGRIVLVMGAGEMGEIAARALMTRGATGIIVANRTYDRALALARELGGEAMTFDRQIEALARADIVLTTTDAPHVVLTHEKVAAAMAQRPERPMVIVDIAVPRDTDPAVANIPGVCLYDIDDLRSVVNGNLEARQQEMPQAEAIAAQEAQEFMCWFETLEVVPTIADLRGWAQTVKAQELARALRRLDHLNEREREVVRALAHGLVNKLLHEPTVQLKQRAMRGDGHLYAEVVRELFALEGHGCTSEPHRNGGDAA
jgi:glutamyl-tRNA reductase